MKPLIRVLWAIQKELHTIASCMESKNHAIHIDSESFAESLVASPTSRSKRRAPMSRIRT